MAQNSASANKVMPWHHHQQDGAAGIYPIKEAVRIVHSPDEGLSRLTNETIRDRKPSWKSTAVTLSSSVLQTSATTMAAMDEGS